MNNVIKCYLIFVRGFLLGGHVLKQYLNSSGSKWRKWDLHVHSPESKLHNEFRGWDEYLEALENLEDISVIGITDYYSIDGYLKVKEYKSEGRLTNIDLVLPNVEMRIDTVTSRDRPINLHIIFSPDIVDCLEDKFFRELKYEFNGQTFTCVKNDLMSLGRLIRDNEISDEEALKLGMNQFKVSVDKLSAVFKQNKSLFDRKYLAVVANKSTDGASGLRETSMQIEQRKIYQFAHAIFSSRSADREFFLGLAEGHSKASIKEKLGSLKPCIHGSDAHKIEKICKPDLNRFTWIKADPTFNGLLQILHEPNDRVLIQEDNPDIKADYNVITSVCFSDSETFTPNEIKLNSGLNTIIGGKSSGKSLLLYKIAQAVSDDEIKYRSDDHWKNPYKSSFIEKIDFKVNWRNGLISSNLENGGKITYIPQMYINSLSEGTANKDLQKKIREILTQRVENRNFLNDKRDQSVKLTSDIKYDIVRLFEKVDDLEKVDEELKVKGNKESIIREREKLNKLIEEKLFASSLTKNEEQEFHRLENEKKHLQELLNIESKDNYSGNNISRELNNIVDYINTNLKECYDGNSERYYDILDELRTSINNAFLKAQSAISERNIRFIRLEEEFNNKITEVGHKLTPYMDKIKGLSDITTLKHRLQEQDRLLQEIELIDDKRKTLLTTITKIKDGIYNTFEKYFMTLKVVKEYFDDKIEFSNLVLKTNINFDNAKFEDNFLSMFNRKGKINNLFPDSDGITIFDEDGSFVFEEDSYLLKMNCLFNYILMADQTQLKLRKSFTKQQAVEQLFNTSFTNIVYDLIKDGDSLSEMSPGKRGLVLLELFLDMSDDKHPILIDQPEDNLDNRTISKDLVDIIKNKKSTRQIIIVTHNANLVVLTDSDNIIVANQDLQLKENERYRFEYITGSIECDFNESNNTKLIGKGIKSHVCEILEGGQEAFEIREKKYGF